MPDSLSSSPEPKQQVSLPPPSALTAEQVGGIVSDRFKDLYDFAGKQITESRASFERYYKTTLGALGLVAAAALGTFYYFLGQQRKDINEIVSKQADSHFNALDRELEAKIEARIENEFKTERIQSIIGREAKEATKSGLNNEVSALRSQIEVLRNDLNQYALPRTFTPKQKADMTAVLSKAESRIPVTLSVDTNDGEALNYMNQIAEILRASDWEYRVNQNATSVPGLTLLVELAGSSRPGDPKHHSPDEQITEAFRQAQLQYGGTLSSNKGTYAVSIVIGKRPLTVTNPLVPKKK